MASLFRPSRVAASKRGSSNPLTGDNVVVVPAIGASGHRYIGASENLNPKLREGRWIDSKRLTKQSVERHSQIFVVPGILFSRFLFRGRAMARKEVRGVYIARVNFERMPE